MWSGEPKLINCILWTCFTLYCAVGLCYFRQTENDIHWSLLHSHWKVLQQIQKLCQCPKCSCHQMCKCRHHFVILTFFVVVFCDTITCCFVLFILVTVEVAFLNYMRFKHIHFLCHFLELNYRGLNPTFLILKQLLIDGDIDPLYISENIDWWRYWICYCLKIKGLSSEEIKPVSISSANYFILNAVDYI